MTPIDLIRIAMKTANVESIGQTPDNEDVNDCFIVLNSMLGSWSKKRWLVYNLIETIYTTTGLQSYTIGTTCNFDTPRPDRLHAAYARLLPNNSTGAVDYPLTIIDSYEDYAAISLKELKSFPTAVFYDSAYPTGQIFIYPIPTVNQFEIHLVIKNQMSEFANLTTDISLPPEYQDALIWNLACRIRPMFGQGPDQSLVTLAHMALIVISDANAQIPRLSLPSGLPGGAGGRWAGHGIATFPAGL